jgi:hypothetical protein
MTEVEGEDVLEDERRCVGWKYVSCADNPMRLSTGSPNWGEQPRKQETLLTPTREKEEAGKR